MVDDERRGLLGGVGDDGVESSPLPSRTLSHSDVSDSGEVHDSAPPDRMKLTWLTCMLLGTGVLFPWNAIITVSDYWNLSFSEYPFLFMISLVFNVSNVLMLLVSVKWGATVPVGTRLVAGFVLMGVMLLLFPLVATIIPMPNAARLGLMMVLVFALGIVASSTFGAVMGLCAWFPGTYTGAAMTGNGISGILASGLRAISKTLLPTDDAGTETTAYIFFACGAVLMVLCGVSYPLLRRQAYAQYYLRLNDEQNQQRKLRRVQRREERATRKGKRGVRTVAVGDERRPLLSSTSRGGAAVTVVRGNSSVSSSATGFDGGVGGGGGGGSSSSSSSSDEGGADAGIIDARHAHLGASSDTDGDSELGMSHANTTTAPSPYSEALLPSVDRLDLLKRMRLRFFCAWFVFFTSLSLFPGLIELIVDTTFHIGSWWGLLLIACFQFWDLVGRSLPTFFMLFSKDNVHWPILARAVFFPLFMFCIKPYYIRTSESTILIVSTFAITNGYLGTLSMIFGPADVREHEKETAGIIMAFFLNLGILSGALFAFLLLYLAKGTLTLG